MENFNIYIVSNSGEILNELCLKEDLSNMSIVSDILIKYPSAYDKRISIKNFIKLAKDNKSKERIIIFQEDKNNSLWRISINFLKVMFSEGTEKFEETSEYYSKGYFSILMNNRSVYYDILKNNNIHYDYIDFIKMEEIDWL